MNVLIICSDLGKTAPGKVYETMVDELKGKTKLTVVCQDIAKDVSDDCIMLIPKKIKSRRSVKLLISLFGFNFLDFLWSIQCFLSLRGKKFDLVLSCLSYHNYESLVCGNFLSKRLNVRHICYSVDAVPAPEVWGEPKWYIDGVKKFVKNNLCKVDEFYSSNPIMLEYQKQLFDYSDVKTGVIYTPVNFKQKIIYDNKIESDKVVLLYTGSFYGARNPKYIFEAFRKLLKKYPDAILRFVGTKFSEKFLFSYSDILSNIEILPYQRDLTIFYTEATVLIDVDAEHENDVFLSSKITNYLFIDKPILAETSIGSPSHQLFCKLKSVFIVDHNANSFYNCLIKIIESNSFDYKEREVLKEHFKFKPSFLCEN